MAAYWVVEGTELSVSAASITSNPENVKAGTKSNPKNIYAGNMGIKIENYGSSIITDGNGKGNGVITGTSVNKINEKNIVLDTDSVEILVSGTSTNEITGVKTPVEEIVRVSISNAGQTEVKSN